MWSVFLLVAALASDGLIEAGYVYNVPRPFDLPNNQPLENHNDDGIHEEGKSISYSVLYDDYTQLKNGNTHSNLVNLDQLKPSYDNIPVNGRTNQGNGNIIVMPTKNERNDAVQWNNNYGIHSTHSQSLSNSYTNSPINQLSDTTTTALPSTYNNGYLPPQLIQSADSLSNGFSQVAQTSTSTLNNGYNQAGSASVTPNNAFNALSQNSFGLNNGYGQLVSPDNLASFLPNPNTQPSNVHTQSSSSSDINTNAGYVQSTNSINYHLNNADSYNNLNEETASVTANILNNKIQRTHPVIHKHVYFHVPPPDIEEPLNMKPLPPRHKKNYNILFIKLPSYVSKMNIARVQQQIAQAAAVDTKTLIYVLVKKPEEPKPVILSTLNRSHHQVYFVKYTGNPDDNESQNSDSEQKSTSNSNIPSLAPGLVNGLN